MPNLLDNSTKLEHPATPGGALSVVLIAPNPQLRQTLCKLLDGPLATLSRTVAEYPSPQALSELKLSDFDVVVVELDTNAERALELIEAICQNVSATVMAYCGKNDAALLVRSMRAGARDFLIEPVLPGTIDEALARAAARCQSPKHKKAPGKLVTFIGAKGGAGVTMIATNFAVALTKESAGKVVIVDLDLALGEVALNLNVSPTFSIMDAMAHTDRLDSDFLSTLLIRHDSGLTVLAAPDVYQSFDPRGKNAAKVLSLLREQFEYVVVDAGNGAGEMQDAAFDLAETIYLVTEVNIPALRNAKRITAYVTAKFGNRRLEVILNRFDSRAVEIDQNSSRNALAQPVNWSVPNDYVAVRRAQNSGDPLAKEDSPVSRVLFQMARAACGKAVEPEKKIKKKFSFFG